jgi:hypothetical protein
VRALFFGHLHTPSVRLLRAARRGKGDGKGGGGGGGGGGKGDDGGGGGGGDGGGGGGGGRGGDAVAAADGAAAAAGGTAAGVEMPVMYLSPSLTARNPTPHVPAVRLYALSGPGAAGRAEGVRARAWEVHEAWDHTLEISGDLPVWRVESVSAQLNLSSLRPAAWRLWLDALRDDAAFVRHLSAQRCADEVEAPYAQCKASALCAMGELEDEAYLACIRRTSKRALPPPGWVQGVKQSP